MNTRKKLVSIIVAGVLGSAAMSAIGPTFAADVKTPAQSASAAQKSQHEAVIRTADEAYRALREVRAARVAIFNGVPDAALELANDAVKNLETAQQSTGTLAVKTNKAPKTGDAYLPFDVSIALAEGFVPTEDKAATLNSANEHLSKGNHKAAVDMLKVANIDVSVTAALVPIGESVKHAKDAVALMGQQKYYEANLALKAIEDSVVVEYYDVDAIPVQGGHS